MIRHPERSVAEPKDLLSFRVTWLHQGKQVLRLRALRSAQDDDVEESAGVMR